MVKIGLNCPMPNRVKVWSVAIEANNVAFKGKALLGFESSHPDGMVAKIGLNYPDD